MLSRFPSIIYYRMQELAVTSMRSVRLEPAKLILLRTRTTFLADGDAVVELRDDIMFRLSR